MLKRLWNFLFPKKKKQTNTEVKVGIEMYEDKQ